MNAETMYLPTGAVVGVDPTHLVRVDNPRSVGWQLRFPKWHAYGPGSRMYSDKKYGGPRGAFAAALAARGIYFKDLPLNPAAYTSNKRSTTGVSGVNLNFTRTLLAESAFAWVASWMEKDEKTGKNRQKKMRFSLGMYEFEEALDLAIATRELQAGIKVSPEQREQAMALRYQVTEWVEQGKTPTPKPVGDAVTKVVVAHTSEMGISETHSFAEEAPADTEVFIDASEGEMAEDSPLAAIPL